MSKLPLTSTTKVMDYVTTQMGFDSMNAYSVLNANNVKKLETYFVDNAHSVRDAIYTLKFFPFKIDSLSTLSTTTSYYRIGTETYTNIDCKSITNPMTLYKEVARFTAIQLSQYENFLDMNIQLKLHLPFINIVDIPIQKVYDTGFRVVYTFDLIRGECIAYVLTLGNDEEVILSASGICAVDININGSNQQEQFNKAVKTTITMAGGLASASILAGGGFSTLMTTRANMMSLNTLSGSAVGYYDASIPHYSNGGQTQGISSLLSPLDCYLEMLIPQVVFPTANANYNISYTNYAKTYGVPCGQYLQLNSLVGFFKVAEIHLEDLGDKCTETERQEIDKLLSMGVIK